MVQGLNPDTGKRFSSSPKHPDLSGSHPAFYSMGITVLYSG